MTDLQPLSLLPRRLPVDLSGFLGKPVPPALSSPSSSGLRSSAVLDIPTGRSDSKLNRPSAAGRGLPSSESSEFSLGSRGAHADAWRSPPHFLRTDPSARFTFPVHPSPRLLSPAAAQAVACTRWAPRTAVKCKQVKPTASPALRPAGAPPSRTPWPQPPISHPPPSAHLRVLSSGALSPKFFQPALNKHAGF